jgi:hypothetical protein
MTSTAGCVNDPTARLPGLPRFAADGRASVQAGAGIVADSVPEREWEETGNKARALLTALGRIRPVERQAR